jgi:hypothetical protein
MSRTVSSGESMKVRKIQGISIQSGGRKEKNRAVQSGDDDRKVKNRVPVRKAKAGFCIWAKDDLFFSCMNGIDPRIHPASSVPLL